MKREGEGIVARRIAALAQRIEGWRAGGRRGKRMPEELWTAAVVLAEEVGSYRVSRDLGVSYATVRERVAARQSGAAVERVDGARPSFAALDLASVFARAEPEVHIEVTRADGTRLQIRVAAESAAVIAAAVSAFASNAS